MRDLLESFEYALACFQFPLYEENPPSVSCFLLFPATLLFPSLRPRHREGQLTEWVGRAEVALDQSINNTLRFKSLSTSPQNVLVFLAQ